MKAPHSNRHERDQSTMHKTIRYHAFLALMSAFVGCSSDKGSDSGATGSSAGNNSMGTPRAGTTAPTAGAVATGTAGAGAAGTAATACPPLRPVEDAACTTHTQTCTYDEIECRCPAGSWACEEPVDPNCPPMMPAHGSACTVPEGTECEFLQDECECIGSVWTCESHELDDAGTATTPPPTPTPDAGTPDSGISSTPFDAGMAQCPDLRPIEGLRCTVSRVGCMYDTTHCVCPEGMWLCSENVDPTCPIEPPTPGSACTGRADCDYFDIECECLRDMWSCKAND